MTDSLNVTDLTLFGTKLLATTKTGVFVSLDSAKNWSDISGAIGSVHVLKVYSSATYAYVITADSKVYQSDLVNAWTLIQIGLPLNVATSSLAFYDGKILLGAKGDGVYTASETFNGWSALNTGLSNKNVTSVTTLVRAAGTKLFAGTDGAGVFVADAKTGTWTATAALSISHTTMIGLDGTKIEAMATYGGYVFASYQGGLLATKDFGQTWVAGGNQFNLPSYTHVRKISCVTTRVYVVTDNNGLYSNGLSELDLVANVESSVNAQSTGACNGSATVVAVAGTGNYTYLWSDNQTTSTATNLCAGKYYVTVTSGVETYTDSVIISEPNVINETENNLISVYPNPSNDGNVVLNLSSVKANITSVAVYDYSGKLVQNVALIQGSSLVTLNLGSASGIYFVKVNAEGKSYSTNVIVE